MKIVYTVVLIMLSLPSFSQDYPDFDALCGEIDSEFDASIGQTVYFTPYDNPIYFKKYASDGKEAYKMTINVVGPSKQVGKGVIIRLQQNYSIRKPDVVTEVYQDSNGQYIHYATFTLNKNDISMLKNYLITNYELYMYMGGESDNNLKYQAYMYCMTKYK
jgi:hypothetical protein